MLSKVAKFRYNALAAIQVSINLVSSILLIKAFGVSDNSDVFLLASSIVMSLQLIQMMFVEQFLYFYNDLKTVDNKDAEDFYRTAITWSIFIGMFCFLCFFISNRFILNIFAYSLDSNRFNLLSTVFKIMIVGSLFDSVNHVNQRLLNAEMKFSVPYILESSPNLFLLSGLLYSLLYSKQTVVEIASIRTAGVLFTALLGFVFVARSTGVVYAFQLKHHMMKAFVKNSFSMRLGHNIHNLAFTPLTNNILSSLPAGFVSYYYYAFRIITAIYSVTVGPSYRIFMSQVSSAISGGLGCSIKNKLQAYLRKTIVLYISLVMLTYFILPRLFEIIASGKVSKNDVSYITIVFLLLSVWYLIAAIESPFVSVVIATKNSRIFMISNSLFLAVYSLLAYSLLGHYGIYSVPIAAAIAQLINLIIYSSTARKFLSVHG